MKSPSSEIIIHVPLHGNELLEKALEAINSNIEIKTLWRITNVTAQDRLGWADHGPVHFQIVANVALRMARILLKNNVDLSVTKDYGLNYKYAELIVLLASLFHDMGMSVHRSNHEEYSLFLANNLLREILTFLPTEERTIVISETLHAIICHSNQRATKPLTIEAGIVRVADALDMSEGRIKMAYEAGAMNIHAISAAAINGVEIEEGDKKPIQIIIIMNNSAGLFQIDDLLEGKLGGSGIEKYVMVKAYVEGETEKKLITEFSIGND